MGPATVNSVRIPVDVVNGLFFPKVTINGTPVRMVADTGETLISLSAEDARKVGVDPQSLQFTGEVKDREWIGAVCFGNVAGN